MTCDEMARLRKRMAQLREKLKEQKRKARAFSKQPRPGRFTVGRSDYEPLLQRRIQLVATEIERHVKTHGCQE